MKSLFLFLIVLMFPAFLSCQEDYMFSKLITYGESESFEVSFKNTNGSKEFIDKFNLNESEVNFVGYWTDNFYSEIKQNGKNVRIQGLDFFPNRILEMKTECFINGKRIHQDYFFLWKIEKEQICIKVLSCLSKTDNQIQNFVFYNNTNYETIGEAKFYKDNYILIKQFDFSFMNLIIYTKSIEFGMDDFRYRILSEQAMPSIYDKINTNLSLRKFLLNFDTTKKSDFIKLEEDYNRWN